MLVLFFCFLVLRRNINPANFFRLRIYSKKTKNIFFKLTVEQQVHHEYFVVTNLIQQSSCDTFKKRRIFSCLKTVHETKGDVNQLLNKKFRLGLSILNFFLNGCRPTLQDLPDCWLFEHAGPLHPSQPSKIGQVLAQTAVGSSAIQIVCLSF